MTFVEHLSRYTPVDWASAIESLTPQIHPIDINATRVWFAFFPAGPAPADLARSHTFLYGHRYWPQIKRAILAAGKETSWPALLPELIWRVAEHATRTTQVDRDQLIGVAAASLLSLRRAGLDLFTEAVSAVQLPSWSHVRSIRQVRRARAHQRWRPLGKRRCRVIYSEASPETFGVVPTGSAIVNALPSSWRQCGATCAGLCVIGVIGGEHYLSPMDAAELKQLNGAGQVIATSVNREPLIRLACHARAHGDVSIVLAPPTAAI